MKHIRLFEDYNSNQESPKSNREVKFGWVPYTAKINDPIQKSIPDDLSPEKLIEFLETAKKDGKIKEIEKAGAYVFIDDIGKDLVSHTLSKSLDPLLFDTTLRDYMFQEKEKYEDLSIDQIVSKSDKFNTAARLLNRSKLFNTTEED